METNGRSLFHRGTWRRNPYKEAEFDDGTSYTCSMPVCRCMPHSLYLAYLWVGPLVLRRTYPQRKTSICMPSLLHVPGLTSFKAFSMAEAMHPTRSPPRSST